MKRRLIKQKDSYTITVPIDWVRSNSIDKDSEVSMSIEQNKLIIQPGDTEKQLKKTEVKAESTDFKVYRSLIGGLYRGAYDEIKLSFNNPKIIPALQNTVDTLYGYEIFDIDKKSCVIRTVFKEQAGEISSHINKMIHIIKTMQDIILEDIQNNKLDSLKELDQFRWNCLKHRDLIARTIIQQKLLDNNHFPYYNIAFNLWQIARAYFYMYKSINNKQNPENIKLLEKVNNFFKTNFAKENSEKISKKYNDFSSIINNAIDLTKKEKSTIASFCLQILMLSQSTNSSLLLLNY